MNISFFNFLFGTKLITEDKIHDFVADTNAKRICFSRIQKHIIVNFLQRIIIKLLRLSRHTLMWFF